MPEPLLALEGVTLLAPDGSPILQHLTWSLRQGERYHLQCGRDRDATAFLGLCCGLRQPREGRVMLGGVALDHPEERHPFLDRGALGYVPPDGGLIVNMSLQDNVALPLRFNRNAGREAAAATALEWLDRAGLRAWAYQRPHVPGDGQTWLASLARAGAKGPELLLVDRPSGGLDAPSVRAAKGLLEAVIQENLGVALVLAGPDWMSGLGQPLNLEDGRLFSGRP
jgi:ABC-type ATPase involved in cell division